LRVRREQSWTEGGSSDVRWKTVPQTSGCNRKRSVANSVHTSDVRRPAVPIPSYHIVVSNGRAVSKLEQTSL